MIPRLVPSLADPGTLQGVRGAQVRQQKRPPTIFPPRLLKHLHRNVDDICNALSGRHTRVVGEDSRRAQFLNDESVDAGVGAEADLSFAPRGHVFDDGNNDVMDGVNRSLDRIKSKVLI